MSVDLTGAKRLQDLRMNAHLTQRDVQKKTGIAASSISQYEQGITAPSWENIKLLCALYQCSADYMLGLPPMASTETNVVFDARGLPREDILLISLLLSNLRQKNGIRTNDVSDSIGDFWTDFMFAFKSRHGEPGDQEE